MTNVYQCPSCSASVEADEKFCGECGTKLPEKSTETTPVAGRWLFSGSSSTATFQEDGEVIFYFEGEEEIAEFQTEWEARGNWEQIGRKLLFDCNKFTMYEVEIHGDRMIGTCFHTSGDDKGVHTRTVLEREGVDLSNQEMPPAPALEDRNDGSYAALLFKGFKNYFLSDDDDDNDAINNATIIFEQAVKIDPERPEAFVGLGMCYCGLDDYKAALPHIEQAINNNFGYDDRYESIRFEHVPDGGDPDDLLEYELTIEVVIMYRAIIHLNFGDIDLAQRDIDGVFDAIPEEYAADKNLVRAGIFFERNDLENALQHVEKALSFDPEDAGAHHMRGELLFEKKDMKAAIKAFSRAINLEPRYPDALLSRAKAFSAIGATDKMKADVKAIREKINDGYGDADLLGELNELFGE